MNMNMKTVVGNKTLFYLLGMKSVGKESNVTDFVLKLKVKCS